MSQDKPLSVMLQQYRWYVTSIIGCELVNLTHQGTGDQVLCVLASLNTPGHQ